MTKGLKFVLALLSAIFISGVEARAQFADQRQYAGASTGSANLQSVNIPNYALNIGVVVRFKASFTNTAALSLIVNNSSPIVVDILTPTGLIATSGGELHVGQIYQVVYDGNVFQLVGAASLLPNGPFTATGIANSAASIKDRSTFKGVSYDARADFGLVCDGATDDTTKFIAMLAAIQGSAFLQVHVTFPGLCTIQWQNYAQLTRTVVFEGLSGGGIKLLAGQTLAGGNLLTFFSGSTIQQTVIKNFKLDLNGNGPTTAGVQVIDFQTAAPWQLIDSQIVNGAPPTANTGAMLLVTAYGTPGCVVRGNTFSLTAASPHQNEALNMGTTSFPVLHCSITHNKLINTGLGVFSFHDLKVSDNEVYGWGFGGGLTLDDGARAGVPNGQDVMVVSNNFIHDNAAVVDDNNTFMNGIENWVNGADLIGNVIQNTCGAGISIGGQSLVTGNVISNSGSCTSTSGFAAGISGAFRSATNGSFSIISGNTVYDTASTTTHGYNDQSGVTNVTLGINNFQGTHGAYHILAGSAYSAPNPNNLLVNPCFEIDQAGNGASKTSGYFADGWKLTSSTGHITALAVQGPVIDMCQVGVKFTTTTSSTPAAGDFLVASQTLSYGTIEPAEFGTVLARNLIFAFCAATSLSPPNTFGFVVQNLNGGGATFVGTYTIATPANTHDCFSFQIPGNTSSFLGSVPNYSTAALAVAWDLGSGSSHLGSATGAWQNGSVFYGATGTTQLEAQPNTTTLTISDARLHIAPADQGFTPPRYLDVVASAQPFYQSSFTLGTAPAQNVGVGTGEVVFPATIAATGVEVSPFITFEPDMYKTPTTMTGFNPAAANANCRDETISADGGAATFVSTAKGFYFTCTGNASTVVGDKIGLHYTADARP